MPKCANKNMQEICTNMQKHANKNMQKYAKIYMQKYAVKYMQ